MIGHVPDSLDAYNFYVKPINRSVAGQCTLPCSTLSDMVTQDLATSKHEG